jgi:hypothetical protein
LVGGEEHEIAAIGAASPTGGAAEGARVSDASEPPTDFFEDPAVLDRLHQLTQAARPQADSAEGQAATETAGGASHPEWWARAEANRIEANRRIALKKQAERGIVKAKIELSRLAALARLARQEAHLLQRRDAMQTSQPAAPAAPAAPAPRLEVASASPLPAPAPFANAALTEAPVPLAPAAPSEPLAEDEITDSQIELSLRRLDPDTLADNDFREQQVERARQDPANAWMHMPRQL